MIKWSVKHIAIVMMFVIMILGAGAFSYTALERQENPTIAGPVAAIKCIYPGASPEDIEKLIVKPIEDKVGENENIKRIESYAMDSIGIIKVTLKDMSDAEISKVWEDIKEDVDEVESELPSNCMEPTIETDFTSCYGMILGLTSEDYTYEDLSQVAEDLKERLEQDPGVKAVDIDGEVGNEVDINLDLVKLEQYGISPTTIATALKARNINIPGGNLEIGNIKAPVQISGEYWDIEEIKDTIIGVSPDTGMPVYLKNIAEVIEKAEKKEVFATVGTDKALLIGVKFMDGQNMLAVESRLKRTIDGFKADGLYENMKFVVLSDQGDFVKSAIDLFQDNLIAAIVLVVVVVLLTMGIRSALVVSFPIPIVVAMVFIYMYVMEIPLHQVSIASLIVSLSLLVANGIVANDNINVYLDRGQDRMAACTSGVGEVNIPILTSTLTTVASFLPLAMMQGVSGKFVKTMPILVAVALLGSYLTSLTVVPAMGYILLIPKNKNPDDKKLAVKIAKALKLELISKFFTKGYRKTLKLSLKHPALLILVFVGIFIASLRLVPGLGVQLFPPVERDQYIIDITVKNGSTAEKTEEAAAMVSRLLEKDESVESFACKVGDGMMKYYITFVPNDPASNKAQFIVNGDRNERYRIERELSEKVPGVQVNVLQLETAAPVTYPVQVRISGDDVRELRRISEDVGNKLHSLAGVKFIEDDWGSDSYRLNIEVNEEKANMVGITNYDIASMVRMAVNGLELSELKQEDIEKDPIPIVLKVPEEQKKDRDILNNIFLTSQVTGRNVPIGQIAEIRTESSLNKIVRRDSKRTITVGMFAKEGYSSTRVMEACEELLKDYRLPDGYSMKFGGDSEERTDSFNSMGLPAVLALIIIYVIMVFQFGDLVKPLIIMGTIPLSFIGIIWGLKIMGYPVGFMALLGAISLMGVVVNNGIVLLDYINILTREYEDKTEAVVEACETRLRPIVIGMLTTVISLIPMLYTGGALWAPMAASIVFGMMVSTVLTLYIIPCAYFLVKGRKFNKHRDKKIFGRSSATDRRSVIRR